jgi:chemotaxis protein MotB
VEITATGVTFRIAAPVLFASGTASLKREDTGVLEELAGMIRKYPYEVRVEGHTDDRPIATLFFPSNWHLSAARAVTVASRLQELGVAPQRLGATGYGEFRPLDDNATPAGRERNRRVEIFLEIDRQREVGDHLPLVDLESGTVLPAVEPELRSPVTERLRSLRTD